MGYANHLMTIGTDLFLDTLKEITEEILGAVETWHGKIALSVNPKKTEIIVFTGRYK